MESIRNHFVSIIFTFLGIVFLVAANSCASVREGVKIVREFDELIEDQSIKREIRKEKKLNALRRELRKHCRNVKVCVKKKGWYLGGGCAAYREITQCQDKYGKWIHKK